MRHTYLSLLKIDIHRLIEFDFKSSKESIITRIYTVNLQSFNDFIIFWSQTSYWLTFYRICSQSCHLANTFRKNHSNEHPHSKSDESWVNITEPVDETSICETLCQGILKPFIENYIIIGKIYNECRKILLLKREFLSKLLITQLIFYRGRKYIVRY